jgi:hypothetical protein
MLLFNNIPDERINKHSSPSMGNYTFETQKHSLALLSVKLVEIVSTSQQSKLNAELKTGAAAWSVGRR